MQIQMFNGWYFLFLGVSLGIIAGLYFLLRNKSQKTQKIVLFSILIFSVIVHFTKGLYPPYSLYSDRLWSDSWFINICAANIFLFPIFFLSNNKYLKDYMVYVGILSGLLAIIYPMEPMLKDDQAGEWIDIIRFYYHHTMLCGVPFLMLALKLHTLSYKRVFVCPAILMGVFAFIMLNQVLQSELGFVPLRSSDFFEIGYKNSSLIWGPDNDVFISQILTALCPPIFKYVPVGVHAGAVKYWPWFWLLVPVFIILPVICFLFSMITDHKNFKNDLIALNAKIKVWRAKRKQTAGEGHKNSSEKVIDSQNNATT